MSALQWNPVQVAALMDREDIVSRGELAKRLPRLLRATLYRSLDVDWAGTAHPDVLVHMAVVFNVPIGRLVCDPRRRPSGDVAFVDKLVTGPLPRVGQSDGTALSAPCRGRFHVAVVVGHRVGRAFGADIPRYAHGRVEALSCEYASLV